MTLHLPDDILKEAGISEQEALLELAIRLLHTDRLGLTAASHLAGLDRVHFEIELNRSGCIARPPRSSR
jgi:predicted HTH domain antitoxin